MPWLRDLLLANNIELAVSINDFRLSRWSALPASSEWASLIRLDLLNQSIVEDKVLMNKVLESSGILIPRTWTGERPNLIAEESSSYRFVTKGGLVRLLVGCDLWVVRTFRKRLTQRLLK